MVVFRENIHILVDVFHENIMCYTKYFEISLAL